MNKDIEVVTDRMRVRPKKSEVNRLLSSNLKAKKYLNWVPLYKGKKGYEKGLKETIKWFSEGENIKVYKSNIYNY